MWLGAGNKKGVKQHARKSGFAAGRLCPARHLTAFGFGRAYWLNF
jgi:hypothetical protein